MGGWKRFKLSSKNQLVPIVKNWSASKVLNYIRSNKNTIFCYEKIESQLVAHRFLPDYRWHGRHPELWDVQAQVQLPALLILPFSRVR